MEILLAYVLFIVIVSLAAGVLGGVFEVILWIGNWAIRKNDRLDKYMVAAESRKRRAGA
jgi:uncharacterized protein YneF (UPF0154 family)